MQYKTIVLELLQQRPELHERLRQQRQLLATVEGEARNLKAHHTAWKDVLARSEPPFEPSQITSLALELALEDLQNRFNSESLDQEPDAASLDAAMAYLLRHSSNG